MQRLTKIRKHRTSGRKFAPYHGRNENSGKSEFLRIRCFFISDNCFYNQTANKKHRMVQTKRDYDRNSKPFPFGAAAYGKIGKRVNRVWKEKN